MVMIFRNITACKAK